MPRIFNAPVRSRPQPPRAIPSLLALAAITALVVACAPQSTPHSSDPPALKSRSTPKVAQHVPAANAADLGKPQTACWLLPGDVVSKVFGESLTPVADLGAIKYGNTSCNYYAPGKQPGDDAPLLTVTLDWNGFNVIAMHIPDAGPATPDTPYADAGDGALLDSGVLFVRAGEHSVAFDLRGDGDLHSIAAQLMAAAKPRLAQ